ncbi:MAG: hypothetical protein FWB85_01510 [Chitinispirillia bacterium]|nr:hypothetical protein [Chitinispirillia bacterium]MCL2241100.1 hypothetical protein [Chitinispirillia bacterium]
MKRCTVLLVVCVMCVGIIAPAYAQDSERRTSFSAGYLSPLSPKMFSDYWKPGYFIGVSEIWTNPEGIGEFGWLADVGILGFDYDKAYGERPDDVYMATLYLRLGFSVRFSAPAFPYPYISATMGFGGFLGGSDFDKDEKISFAAVALSAGAGVRIPIGDMKLIIDAQCAMITKFVETVTYWPIKIELELPFSLMAD